MAEIVKLSNPANHMAQMFAGFQSFLHSQFSTDVTIVCGSKRFKVHKVLLCACSPLFKQLLTDNNSKHSMVIFDEYPEWAVEQVIEFIYSGEVHVFQEQLRELFEVGRSLQVMGLFEFAQSEDIGANEVHPAAEKRRSSTDSNHLASGRRKQQKPMRCSVSDDEQVLVAPHNSPDIIEPAQGYSNQEEAPTSTLRDLLSSAAKPPSFMHSPQVFSTPMTMPMATLTPPMMSPLTPAHNAFMTPQGFPNSVGSASGSSPPEYNQLAAMATAAHDVPIPTPKRRGRKPKVGLLAVDQLQQQPKQGKSSSVACNWNLVVVVVLVGIFVTRATQCGILTNDLRHQHEHLTPHYCCVA